MAFDIPTRLLAIICLAFFWMTTAAIAQQTQTIDILVLYTPETEVELERRGRFVAQEIEFVAHMQNRIFEHSGVVGMVNVVAKRWDEFVEATEVPDHLKCDLVQLNCVDTNFQLALLEMIDNATGANDKYGIKRHRKEANADLVSLWPWRGGWDTTGSAANGLKKWHYSAGVASASKEVYLSLIVAEKAWLWWHFAHELGHNFGLADTGDDETELINSDAFGYVDASFPFRTIMASDGPCEAAGFSACMRIPLYSNADPKFSYLGRAIGAIGSDAAKTINQTLPFVASYSDHLEN